MPQDGCWTALYRLADNRRDGIVRRLEMTGHVADGSLRESPDATILFGAFEGRRVRVLIEEIADSPGDWMPCPHCGDPHGYPHGTQHREQWMCRVCGKVAL